MSVIDAEAKARLEYKNNPEKVLSKLNHGYCQRKAMIPYEMSSVQFEEMIAAYKRQFPNGTTLDALRAFNNQCKLYETKFLSRIPLALGQIAELEGRFEIALRNYFECLVMQIVEDLSSFESLAPYHKEWKNNPVNYLKRSGEIDYLKKGSLVGDRIAQIIKKSQSTEMEVFSKYKYIGSLPSCCLTIQEINDYISNSIKE